MGAEVIKVESALRPEYARRDHHYHVVNNNKRSCTINITRPEGQELIRRLVAVSDVMVENFSVGVLKKFGLDYESMSAIRPSLIYMSTSGLGRTGPERDALAYGTLLQAYSGRARMIGSFNSRLEGMGISGWTDPVTAAWGTAAMLAAALHLRRTGEGAYIDLSMIEGIVALLPEALLREAVEAPTYPTGGNHDFGSAPSGCFRCAGDDEWIAISVRSDAEWRRLCEAMGREQLAADPKYGDESRRMALKPELDALVEAWTRTVDAKAAECTLTKLGVPAGRTRSITEVLEAPDVTARGSFPELANGWRTTSLPWMDADGWRPELTDAPELGADNDYVFGEVLGMPKSEIERLMAEEVIK
jgi:benzylsuccinate CoA-transferase BbsF subunit